MSDTLARPDNTPRPEPDQPGTTDTPPPLGLIGLQAGGLAMAAALRQAGLRLLVWDDDLARRAAAAADHDLADSAQDLAARCRIVLLALGLGQDAAAIHATLLDHLAPGSLIIDRGPSLPGATRGLAAELAQRGLRLIDAPAIDADPPLVIVGGAAADLALAAECLRPFGTVIATGAVGSAQAMAALLAELEEPASADRIAALIG